MLLRHALPIAGLVLLLAACGGPAATPGGSATAGASAPASQAATDAAPTDAASDPAPTTSTVTPADLGGTWTIVPSNPRVIAATGGHAGGSVVIEGNHSIFTAGSYSSDWPIEISGTKALTCTATSCKIEGVPLHQVFLVEGRLAILHAATLAPLGTFGSGCPGWVNIPDGGVISVLETGTVAGQEVPTVVRFADGTASGVGTACDMGSHVVTWDVTATRQP